MHCRILAIAILILPLHQNLTAAPKIALVRVRDIYIQMPETQAAQSRAQKAKNSLLLDPRAEELRQGINEMRVLQKTISDPNKKPTNEEARELARKFEIKRLETRTLQEDFEKFRTERQREINGEMVAQMRIILNRIHTLSQRTAREQGYDIALDPSGLSNTGLPFVLYAKKDSPDITSDVMAAIADDDATREQPTTTAPSSPDTTTPSTPQQPDEPAQP